MTKELSRSCPRRSSGFTLLELLVVLVIIGLLASYVGPRLFSQVGKSETKVAKAQIEAFSKALSVYRLDTGHYMIPRRMDTQGNAAVFGESTTLVFSCVSPDDPEYQRPNLRQDANTIIEYQRK